ncbi:MAG: menaquinone biosynthetic enzyme MqnA/MqnD family protein [Desulforhopalus sp.]
MNIIDKNRARIGIVNYLNTAPIHEKWKDSVARENWVLIEAAPTDLNRKLAGGEIDLGFVSSYEYGLHPERYKLLSGLSISANGSVGSVYLFSHVPLDQLHQQPVLLSSQSETSVSLLKIILEEFNSVTPEYTIGDVKSDGSKDFKALLAIGDEALQLVESSAHLYMYDLGDIWKRETDLPFVFGVCAVREEFCEQQPELLAEIHRELLRCRDEGKEDLERICEIVAPRIPMSTKKCRDYLEAIEYDLGGAKRKALETFYNMLIRRGDIDENALPLKIFANLY